MPRYRQTHIDANNAVYKSKTSHRFIVLHTALSLSHWCNTKINYILQVFTVMLWLLYYKIQNPMLINIHH
jgi:hypothetical protein